MAKFGVPTVIISDNGQEFSSFRFNDFSKILGIHHKTTTDNRANGFVERFHRIIKTARRNLDASEEWKKRLPYTTLALNNQLFGKNAFTPIQYVFSKSSKLPKDQSPPGGSELLSLHGEYAPL